MDMCFSMFEYYFKRKKKRWLEKQTPRANKKTEMTERRGDDHENSLFSFSLLKFF